MQILSLIGVGHDSEINKCDLPNLKSIHIQYFKNTNVCTEKFINYK